MIVGKVWDSEYPWDVRVEKVGKAITEAGHRVVLACRNRRRAELTEQREEAEVHRMPPLERVPALEGLSSFPAFVNPRWYRHLSRTFSAQRVDLVLCRDLPLGPLALAVARRLGVPFFIDIAEHYPGLLKDLYNRRDFRVTNLLVRNPVLAAGVERWLLPRADGVWVVVDEMAERLARMGVARDRITLVSNTPLPERVARIRTRDHAQSDGTLRLVYLGNVERSRGLHLVIDAMGLLGPTIPVRLDVFGAGSSLEVDQARARELGLDDRIRFRGRVPYDEVLDCLHEFDVGLIPHHATDHWNYTIQNKFFDYMMAGLPLLVSSMAPAARMVGEIESGLVFRDRDPNDLAARIRELMEPSIRARMGAAGRAGVEREHHWGRDATRLVASLEAQGRGPAAARRGPPEPEPRPGPR